MADDITLGIRLTADGSDLVGAVRVSKNEIDKLGDTTGKAGRSMSTLERGTDLARRQMERMRGASRSLYNTIFSLKGLIATVGIGAMAKSFIEAASTAEQYRVRLKVLLGDVAEGNRLFANMAEFASRVPFEYREIMGAATQLSGVLKGGVDQITQWMPLIGDLAAASGLGIQTTTEQVIRMMSAGAASADLFRERGILAMLGFQAGVSYSAEQTAEQVIKAWTDMNSKFRGATNELADTWDGAMSMLSDKWFAFRNMVMDGGLFDYIKGFARVLDEEAGQAMEDSKSQAKAWSETVITGIENIIRASAFLVEAWNKVHIGLKTLHLGWQTIEFAILSGIRNIKEKMDLFKAVPAAETFVTLSPFGATYRMIRGALSNTSADELTQSADQSAASMQRTQGDLNDLIKNGGGFDAEELIRRIRTEAEGTAEAAEKTRIETDKMMEGITGSGEEAEKALKKQQEEYDEIIELSDKVAKRQRDEARAYQKKLKDRVGNLGDALLTEIEAEEKRYREGLELLDEAERQKIETMLSYDELRARLEEDHQQNIQKIRDQANSEATRLQEEAAKRQAEIMQRPYINALEGIQSSFTDFFRDVFSGGVNSFRSLADAVKNIFINLAAEIAALMVFRPVVGNILGAVGAGGLAASLGLGDVAGAVAGGGGGLMNISGLGSLFSGLGSPGLATFGFNAAQALGFGVPASSFIASGLGFSPVGAIGGIAASLLGLGDGGMASTLLGAGGSFLGGGLGASFAALGAAGGPIGAIVGSFIGTALGGLFGGGNPAHVTAKATSDLTGRDVFARGGKTSPGLEGIENTEQIAAQLSSLMADVTGGLGAELNDQFKFMITQLFNPNDGDRSGQGRFLLSINQADMTLQGRSGQKGADLMMDDLEEFLLQSAQLILKQPGAIQGLDPRLQAVVQNSQAQDLEGLAGDLDFAMQLLGIGKHASEAAMAIAQVTGQFDQMRDRAEQLGLSIELVTQKETEALQALEQQTVAGLSQLVNQARNVLGLDALHKFRESLAFGNLSPLSSGARLAEARSLLDERAQAALAGDLNAVREFPQLAQQVLGLGRDVFASGPEFAELFTAVNSTLNQVITRQESFESSIGVNLELAMQETSQNQIANFKQQIDRVVTGLEEVRSELARRDVA